MTSPPDDEKRQPEEYHSHPRYFGYDERFYRCVYDFQTPSKVSSLIHNFEAGTFTKWKRFRGVGFEKRKLSDRSSRSVYDINEYSASKLRSYGDSLLKHMKN